MSPSAAGSPKLPARRLMFVHAHPDDETIITGGTMARYAAEGAHVCLVTCTNGEMGEIAGAEDPEAIRPRLGEVRLTELREACGVLGVTDVRLLGYRDSGMAGTVSARSPEAFANHDLVEVASRLTAILLQVRPHVVVTYDPTGLYGHPDHIQAHRATVAAIASAVSRRAWQVRKLYYAAFPRSVLRRIRDLAGTGERADDVSSGVTPDEDITTRIDVRAHLEAKMSAMRSHRTQYGTTRLFLELPADSQRALLGAESYVRARPEPADKVAERDLLEGLQNV